MGIIADKFGKETVKDLKRVCIAGGVSGIAFCGSAYVVDLVIVNALPMGLGKLGKALAFTGMYATSYIVADYAAKKAYKATYEALCSIESAKNSFKAAMADWGNSETETESEEEV